MAGREQPAPRVFRSTDADHTREIGSALGRAAQPGDVLLLAGELGAGKTTFVQGFAAGAGATEVVTSPTFVLVNEYRGRLPIYHADLYRLDEPDEVAAMQLSEASLDGVLLVEWPERGEMFLPSECLRLQIEHDEPETRILRFSSFGARAEALLAALVAAPVGGR